MAIREIDSGYDVLSEDLNELTGLLPTGCRIDIPYAPEDSDEWSLDASGLWRYEGWLWLRMKRLKIGSGASAADIASDKLRRLFRALYSHVLNGREGWDLLTPTGDPASSIPSSADVAWDNLFLLRTPDTSGRVALDSGQAPGMDAYEPGIQLGEERHQATEDEMPVHDHPASSDNDTHGHTGYTDTNTHNHTVSNVFNRDENDTRYLFDNSYNNHGIGDVNTNNDSHNHNVTTYNNTHNHPINVQTAGGGTPFNIRQPYQVMTFMFFTKERA